MRRSMSFSNGRSVKENIQLHWQQDQLGREYICGDKTLSDEGERDSERPAPIWWWVLKDMKVNEERNDLGQPRQF